MARTKPVLARLSELTRGQYADCFVLLAERAKGQTRDAKPSYTGRFRDAHRQVTFMVWADAPWYEACERDWKDGQFYKVRGVYDEHDKYGPQIDIQQIRPVTDADRADGFDPAAFVEH